MLIEIVSMLIGLIKTHSAKLNSKQKKRLKAKVMQEEKIYFVGF